MRLLPHRAKRDIAHQTIKRSKCTADLRLFHATGVTNEGSCNMTKRYIDRKQREEFGSLSDIADENARITFRTRHTGS